MLLVSIGMMDMQARHVTISRLDLMVISTALVFLAHPSNEITQATIDLRPPCPLSGFPAPEGYEASAMPPKNGLRLNDLGRTDQARPEPGHPYQQRPVTAAQSTARRCLPQSDVELMTEKQVLSFNPASRLEVCAGPPAQRSACDAPPPTGSRSRSFRRSKNGRRPPRSA